MNFSYPVSYQRIEKRPVSPFRVVPRSVSPSRVSLKSVSPYIVSSRSVTQVAPVSMIPTVPRSMVAPQMYTSKKPVVLHKSVYNTDFRNPRSVSPSRVSMRNQYSPQRERSSPIVRAYSPQREHSSPIVRAYTPQLDLQHATEYNRYSPTKTRLRSVW
jgi:hypothetical protein